MEVGLADPADLNTGAFSANRPHFCGLARGESGRFVGRRVGHKNPKGRRTLLSAPASVNARWDLLSGRSVARLELERSAERPDPGGEPELSLPVDLRRGQRRVGHVVVDEDRAGEQAGADAVLDPGA